MGIIWSIIIGAIAGCIATAVMQENTSWVKNIMIESPKVAV